MNKRILCVFLFLTPILSFSQRSAEFSFGAGGTFIDIEELVDRDENVGAFATDWGTTSFNIGGNFILLSFEGIGIGAELMYQYLYWYSVAVPYGYQTIYRDYSVSALRASTFLRFGGTSSFNLDLGAGLNFMDGVAPGILLAASYYVPVSERIDIPLRFRMDILYNIVPVVPVSLNTGIRVKL